MINHIINTICVFNIKMESFENKENIEITKREKESNVKYSKKNKGNYTIDTTTWSKLPRDTFINILLNISPNDYPSIRATCQYWFCNII